VFPLKDNIPTRDFPWVTVLLIGLNVVVYFLLQVKGGLNSIDDGQTVKWGAIPYEFAHPGKECGLSQAGQVLCEGQSGVRGTPPDQPPFYLTAFSSMFMHGGLLHIGGNMLFLWIFGNNVEDSMGRVKFVVFYLLGGLAALAGQILVGPNEAVPTIGASGAVAGVLGGYLLLYPRARVLTLVFIIFFVTIIELPALIFLGIWFAQQALFGALDLTNPGGGGGGVAYFAHVGGFAFGLLAIKAFATRRNEMADAPRIPVY
jgi:membrane associated rhomboid family serine protease